MKHLGHISIQDNKVIFVYYKLKKPIEGYLPPLWKSIKDNFAPESQFHWEKNFYKKELEKYNASKREVKVSNAICKTEKVFVPTMSEAFISLYYIGEQRIYGNEACEAEINGKATIIKIL